MKILIAVALCATLAYSAPLDGEVSVVQDTVGNYNYNYLIHGISKSEVGVEGNVVRGAYKYYDPNGVLQHVEYTAGPDGYRATGTNFPVAPSVVLTPVGYTDEVLRARNEHLALLKL